MAHSSRCITLIYKMSIRNSRQIGNFGGINIYMINLWDNQRIIEITNMHIVHFWKSRWSKIKNNSISLEKIDDKLKGINKGIQNISPSPAYLGIVNESFDRKTQMYIVDKNLHF